MQYNRKRTVGLSCRFLLGMLSAALLLCAPLTVAWAGGGNVPSTPHGALAKAKKKAPHGTTVDNLRYDRSAKRSRLVFDLTRPVRFTHQRSADPDQFIVDLKNARLSDTVKNKIDTEGFPGEIEVTQQANPRHVRIILEMDDIAGVKLQTFAKPPRLVMDYFPKTAQSTVGAQPKITLPPVARQITQAQRQARLDIDTIVLDPGHGGKDPGAIGRNGLTEKEVVLDVALRLRDLLRDRLGKNVFLTREKDQFIELDDRAKFANRHKADLFVSIHINSHPKRNTRGVEMYHFGIASDRRAMEVAARENGDSIDHANDFVDLIKADLALTKRIEDSQNLAWETKLAFVNLVGSRYELEDHGVKTAPFYVLRYTAMPSILAELAFISNPTEERRLRQNDFRQRAAEGLFEGIRNYLNSTQVARAR
jgi:N-acetylmuramoyl-L-alanine amidase